MAHWHMLNAAPDFLEPILEDFFFLKLSQALTLFIPRDHFYLFTFDSYVVTLVEFTTTKSTTQVKQPRRDS